MAKQQSLQGRVALVTGAARGVGRATAAALAAEGVKVALVDLDGDAVAAAAKEISPTAIGLPLDVTDHAAFAATLDQVEKELGPLDILVNNAGIMPIGPFEEEGDATAARVLDINLHAMLWSTKDMIKRLKRRGAGGHIVNVSSGAGWIAAGGGATYAASKHGVVGFSHAVAQELSGSDIHISVVAPAVVKTDIGAGLADVKGLKKVTPEQVGSAIVKGIKRRKFVIWVPKVMGVMSLMMCGLPYRVRNFLGRLSNTDRLLLTADYEARAAYHDSIQRQIEGGGPATNGTVKKPRAAAKRGG